MARSLHLVLLLACLTAACCAAYQDPEVVLVDDNDTNDVVPRAKLSNFEASPRWGYTSTPRKPTTPRRPTTPRSPTTPRRPTTPWRPTTPRRPSTTSRSPMDQSITIGGLYPYDRQLVVKTVYKSSTILTINTEYLNVSNLPAYIHCIQIVDQQRDGKNAVATVQSGGLGHNNVSIRFKSKRGGKINYVVIIWGQ